MDKETKEYKPKAAKVEPQSDTIRIRMLRAASTSLGYLRPGPAFNAPREIGIHLIQLGIAEEDKALDGAPETK